LSSRGRGTNTLDPLPREDLSAPKSNEEKRSSQAHKLGRERSEDGRREDQFTVEDSLWNCAKRSFETGSGDYTAALGDLSRNRKLRIISKAVHHKARK